MSFFPINIAPWMLNQFQPELSVENTTDHFIQRRFIVVYHINTVFPSVPVLTYFPAAGGFRIDYYQVTVNQTITVTYPPLPPIPPLAPITTLPLIKETPQAQKASFAPIAPS